MAVEKEKKCFVIGRIGDEDTSERTNADWLLQGIIKPALESDPFNYHVQRADEISEPGLITDQIIEAVIEADLVVADLTGANPNAFYELAIRHMEEGAVIHMAKKGEPLPFDIKDYRAVFFSLERHRDHEEAKVALKKQVEAIEKPEYKTSNPITKARGVLKLARTGDPKDKILADLIEGQRRMEARLKMLEPITVAPGWPRQGDVVIRGKSLATENLPLGAHLTPYTDVSAGDILGLSNPSVTGVAKPAPPEEDDGS